MKKWIVVVLIISPFIYANYKKPLFVKHQQQIYQMATRSTGAIDEAVYTMPPWEGLEFVDWKFVTATRDKNKQSLVSFGIVDYIKVVDQDWGLNVFGLKPREADGGTK